MSKSKNPDMDLFARVVNGVVVEYPVRRLHIFNRAQPVSWYTPVVEQPKPELPAFHRYSEELIVQDKVVLLNFVPVPLTLVEMLHLLKKDGQPLPIAEVDSATVEYVVDLVSDYIDAKVSDFAKTRKYGNKDTKPLVSIMTYLQSSNPKYRSEAKRVLDIRDQAWANVDEYLIKVQSSLLPVPTTIQEIDALIPEMKWPDEDPVAQEELPL